MDGDYRIPLIELVGCFSVCRPMVLKKVSLQVQVARRKGEKFCTLQSSVYCMQFNDAQQYQNVLEVFAIEVQGTVQSVNFIVLSGALLLACCSFPRLANHSQFVSLFHFFS